MREDGTIDFDDGSKTENTRVSYPIYHIENIVKPVSKAGHATKVIFLTADAFGVLPPVSRLTADQTQYHFSLASPPNWLVQSAASPNRRQLSPPASARHSCRCTRLSTQKCW